MTEGRRRHKVLMVGPGPGSPGGMLTVANNYCDGFREDSLVDVDYVGIGTRGSFVHKCAYFARQLAKISGMLRGGGYDICHVHMGDKGGTFRSGIVVARANRAGCKTIIHMHAGNMMLWYESLGNAPRRLVRRILNSSDSFVVLGELWRDDLSALVDPRKIRVIYNGVEPPALDKSAHDVRSFLYLGVLKKQKGLLDLLEAVDGLRDELEGRAEFVIAGKVFDLDVESEASQRGLEGLVRCVGWADGEKKRALLERADASVLPSYWEGLPMSVLETMSWGMPGIATNVGAIPEVVTDGVDGLLFEPGDVEALKRAILALTDDGALCAEMGRRASDTVRSRFSLERQIAETSRLYDEMTEVGR